MNRTVHKKPKMFLYAVLFEVNRGGGGGGGGEGEGGGGEEGGEGEGEERLCTAVTVCVL